MRFRYEISGNWYKGNTHIHSTVSDGGKSFRQIAEIYHQAGYNFLFRTDHWVPSDVSGDIEPQPLLWLDGVELDGVDHSGALYHVVCLGNCLGLRREMGLLAAMEAARSRHAILIVAHPFWCGNTLADIERYGFDGIEIYNHVCHWLNGKSDCRLHWCALLEKKPDILAFAADDAHLRPEHPGWNGGWICVNAPSCTPNAVIAAIRAGNYYSSCGPEFFAIEMRDGRIWARTSEICFARLVGPAWRGLQTGNFNGKSFSEFSFPAPTEWEYAYLEIEDCRGRCAWTNNLFLPDGDATTG